MVGLIINNEHKLCRAFDRLLTSEIPSNYVHCTRLELTMLAYHIIRAPAEDLPGPSGPDASALPLNHGPQDNS